ncbi:hypothetical protein AHAS_Ahas03G0223200 [Arachis hypogaea]
MLADIDIHEFEKQWEAMLEECGVREVEWISDLYTKKYSWASAYIRGPFYAGLRTTSRCESLHGKLGRLNLCVIPDSLVLKRWSKTAKSEANHWSIVNEAIDKGILYKRTVAAFIHLCTWLAKFSCFDEHDYKVYAERIVKDTSMLESKYGVARESSGASYVGGEFHRINVPVHVRTKETGHVNMSLTMTGKKRRKCSNCGHLGHRRTRCTSAPVSSAMDNRNGAINARESGKMNPYDFILICDGADTTSHVKLSMIKDGLSKSFVTLDDP